MGQIIIPLANYKNKEESSFWLPLAPREAKKDVVSGKLHLKILIVCLIFIFCSKLLMATIQESKEVVARKKLIGKDNEIVVGVKSFIDKRKSINFNLLIKENLNSLLHSETQFVTELTFFRDV